MNESLWEALARRTEEMYFLTERKRSDRMLQMYHEIQDQERGPVSQAFHILEGMNGGGEQKRIAARFQSYLYDYDEMKEKTLGKFRIYVRGLGNSGKSTLVNALLAIGEDMGSKLDKKPMTFTIEAFTDEMPVTKATVRCHGSKDVTVMERAEAKKTTEYERACFDESVSLCRKEIEKQCKDILDKKEREETIDSIYREGLFQTSIKEITWGIGKNDFLKNCILIDTPGLKQELRFTNVLEDVRSYEADGIIWVFSSEVILSSTVYKQYKQELEEFSALSGNHKIIAVINMHDSELTFGTKEWQKLLNKAVQWLKEDFDSIIAVNNRLAYDGYVHHSEDLIRSSNIDELKKLINCQFIEKSSDDFFKTHIGNMNDYFHSFYSELEQVIHYMEQYVTKYEKAKALVESGESGCEARCRNELGRAVDVYMGAVERKIDQNIGIVNKLAKMRSGERNQFLTGNIAQTEVLKDGLDHACKICAEEIKNTFQGLYSQCMIGQYETVSLTYRQFEKYMGENSRRFALPEFSTGSLVWPVKGKLWDAYDWLWDMECNSAFMETVKGVGGLLVDMVNSVISNPKKDLMSQMRRSAQSVREEYLSTLVPMIKEDREVCMDVINTSISNTFAPYEEIEQGLKLLKEIQSSQHEIEYKDITFRDMLDRNGKGEDDELCVNFEIFAGEGDS